MVSKYSGSTGRKLGYDKHRRNRRDIMRGSNLGRNVKTPLTVGIGRKLWMKEVTFTVSVMIQWSANWPMGVTVIWPMSGLKLIKMLQTFSHILTCQEVVVTTVLLLWFWSELTFIFQCIFIPVYVFILHSSLCRLSSLFCPDDSDDSDLDLGSGKITLFFVITTLAK